MDISAYHHLDVRMNARGKRVPRKLTPNDKVRAIQRIQNGETKASVSRDIGVPESTLRGWCKNEQKLRFMCNQIAATPIKKVSHSTTENFQPEEKKNAHKFTIGSKFLSGVSNFENNTEYTIPPFNSFRNDNDNNYIELREETTLSEFTRKETNVQKISVTESKQYKSELSSDSFRRCETSTSANYNQSVFIQNYLNQLAVINPGLMAVLNVNLCNATNQSETCTNNWRVTDSKLNLIQRNICPLDNDLYMPENKVIDDKQTGPVLQRDVNGDNRNNDVVKLVKQVTCIKNLNKRAGLNNRIIKSNHNTYRSEERTSHQWCKIFNASLNFLTLAATLATIQASDIYLQGINGNTAKLNHIKVEKGGLTPSFGHSILSNSNSSYIEGEPEDLSMHSTVAKIDAPSVFNSRIPVKSGDPHFTQNEADF